MWEAKVEMNGGHDDGAQLAGALRSVNAFGYRVARIVLHIGMVALFVAIVACFVWAVRSDIELHFPLH